MKTPEPLGESADSPSPTQDTSRLRLGIWSFYFIAKLLMYQQGMIGFNALENLAFAAFLLLPTANTILRYVRSVIAIPLAIALLYHDSWLPPIDRVLSQASLVSNFSAAYLLELVGRFVNWQMIAALIIGWAVYSIVARYVRVGVIVVAAMIAIAAGIGANDTQTSAGAPLVAASAAGPTLSGGLADLDGFVSDFYAKEAQRRVRFPINDASVPFDILFIHVCSLSWDDLKVVGLDSHPIWNRFDFLFRNFNTAASYSGPAAIRLNRANCGQSSHQNLYEPAADECYLMPQLRRSGFETSLALNHDGHFDDFLALIRKQGLNQDIMPLTGVPAPLRSFDNSPIFDDYAVLNRWLELRQKSDHSRMALFYNTISLHDGNRIVSGPDARLSSSDNYRPRLQKLLNDLDAFMENLQKSGRRAIVVVVPEHGAALRGDRFQIAGLREIPTPAITTVPVGVKVIGGDVQRQGAAAQLDDSVSYIGLSQLIARMVADPPYGKPFSAAEYGADLPTTDYVVQNEGTFMIRYDGNYFLKSGRDGWKPYSLNPT